MALLPHVWTWEESEERKSRMNDSAEAEAEVPLVVELRKAFPLDGKVM